MSRPKCTLLSASRPLSLTTPNHVHVLKLRSCVGKELMLSTPTALSVNPYNLKRRRIEVAQGMTKDFVCSSSRGGEGGFCLRIMQCFVLVCWSLKGPCMLYPLQQSMGLQENIIWDVATEWIYKIPRERDCVTLMQHLYNRVSRKRVERGWTPPTFGSPRCVKRSAAIGSLAYAGSWWMIHDDTSIVLYRQ